MDREHYAVMETVCKVAVIISDTESCLYQELLLISCCTGSLCKCLPAYRGPSETISAYGFILKATASEILICYRLSLRSLETLLEEFSGIFRHQQKTLITLSLGDLLCGLLLLDNLNMILPCKVFQSFSIGKALMFHDETDSRT